MLPELPPELLLTLLTKRHAASLSSPSGPPQHDALDSFVLSGAGGLGDEAGGNQVEDVLNELLPDGASSCHQRRFLTSGESRESQLAGAPARLTRPRTCAEASLSQAGLVALLLRTKIQALRQEVELLTDLLDRDQDPTTMGHLQELIGVSLPR